MRNSEWRSKGRHLVKKMHSQGNRACLLKTFCHIKLFVTEEAFCGLDITNSLYELSYCYTVLYRFTYVTLQVTLALRMNIICQTTRHYQLTIFSIIEASSTIIQQL